MRQTSHARAETAACSGATHPTSSSRCRYSMELDAPKLVRQESSTSALISTASWIPGISSSSRQSTDRKSNPKNCCLRRPFSQSIVVSKLLMTLTSKSQQTSKESLIDCRRTIRQPSLHSSHTQNPEMKCPFRKEKIPRPSKRSPLSLTTTSRSTPSFNHKAKRKTSSSKSGSWTNNLSR